MPPRARNDAQATYLASQLSSLSKGLDTTTLAQRLADGIVSHQDYDDAQRILRTVTEAKTAKLAEWDLAQRQSRGAKSYGERYALETALTKDVDGALYFANALHQVLLSQSREVTDAENAADGWQARTVSVEQRAKYGGFHELRNRPGVVSVEVFNQTRLQHLYTRDEYRALPAAVRQSAEVLMVYVDSPSRLNTLPATFQDDTKRVPVLGRISTGGAMGGGGY